MKLIRIEPSPSGAHPPIQNSNYSKIPPGMAVWPETLPTDAFYAHNGFVTLTVEQVDGIPTVTGYEPNLEAWEAWKASLPPEPEPGEDPEPKNELDQLRTEVAALQASTVPVIAAARAYAMTTTDVPDSQALDMATLFPTWEEVLSNGAELAAGRVISKDGQLYRVVQSVTPQAHQVPGGEGMLAVYRPIDREHAGTRSDPIPWTYGMDCITGLYYSYEGVTYLYKGDMIPCVWAPGTPGLWQWEIIKEVN